MPTTIPAAPLAASVSACRRAPAGSEPVSSATRVACSAASSSPARPSGPSRSRSDRACWAASTSVGASSAACPPASTTCSIARSAQTVLPEPTSPCSSRCIGCADSSSAASTSPTSRCPAVSVNGSRASKAARIPSAAGLAGGRGPGRGGEPALRQHRLQRQRLVPLQPGPGGAEHRVVVRPVDVTKRGVQRHQAVPRPHRRRQRVRQRLQDLQHELHAPGDHPGRHRGRGRVDRDQPAGELLDLLVVGHSDDLVLGTVQLAGPVEDGHLAGEQPAPADDEVTLPPGLVEERELQGAAAVADDRLEQRAAALPHRPPADLHHLRQHGHLLADAEVGEVGQLAALGVAARVVPEQLADRAQRRATAPARPRSCRRRRRPAGSTGPCPWHPHRGECDRWPRHSTPISSGVSGWPPA